MPGRLAGSRRMAEALAPGAELLGTVYQRAGQLLLADGTAAAPPVAFVNNTNMGPAYRAGNNDMRVALNGGEQMRFQTSQTTFLNHIQANGNLTAVAGRLGGWRGMQRAGDIAPAALAAGDTNNYAALSGYSVARITPDGGGTSRLGGIVPDTGDGDELIIINLGAANLTIGHQVAGSTASNRILCNTGASIVLAADQAAYLWYDPVATRWRAFAL